MMQDRGKAISVLVMSTLAFTVCFAVWMMNGVLITFLVDNNAYNFTKTEMGFLIGTPVLTGALFRLPVGVLTDKYGGKIIYTLVMAITAIAAWLTSYADSYWGFIFGGLGFGFAGTSFAVGIAYTSIWFPKHQQGTALGIFGAGNAGAAITSLGAPSLLKVLTNNGADIEQWRWLPRIFAISLLVMIVVFWLFTYTKRVEEGQDRSLTQRLQPLKNVRVWRFGLYYFLVFGGFVALAQWLIPYYLNVYTVSLATAGMLASIFTLPSGLIRALGGWMSDKFGARKVMYWVLGGCALCSLLLFFPRMDVRSPGSGVLAAKPGVVEKVTNDTIVVSGKAYPVRTRPPVKDFDAENLIWPTSDFWQEARVKVGDEIKKKDLLAEGITNVYFQANIWIFTGIVFIIGILMGIGKAAVYKHIPEYFPNDVGVVGGIVGVLGGVGGFICPILFGYLLGGTGIWTTCWFFFFAISLISLLWMHSTIRRMIAEKAPHLANKIEHHDDHGGPSPQSLQGNTP